MNPKIVRSVLLPGGNSWVSLIFPELKDKPEDAERPAPYRRQT
jgi:hypothetical protein